MGFQITVFGNKLFETVHETGLPDLGLLSGTNSRTHTIGKNFSNSPRCPFLNSTKRLGVPRHYVRRSLSCWCKVCSCVRGRGHGSNSCGENLMVQGCTRTKQTFWTEDQFTVTSSSGIRDRDTRVWGDRGEGTRKPSLTSGDVSRLSRFGHRRRRDRYVPDTTGC